MPFWWRRHLTALLCHGSRPRIPFPAAAHQQRARCEIRSMDHPAALLPAARPDVVLRCSWLHAGAGILAAGSTGLVQTLETYVLTSARDCPAATPRRRPTGRRGRAGRRLSGRGTRWSSGSTGTFQDLFFSSKYGVLLSLLFRCIDQSDDRP